MKDEPLSRTSLEEYGEFGLIENLTRNLSPQRKNTIKGVGDDAAVISSKDEYRLLSTDMFLEGIHYDLTYCPLKHLGYKTIIANLSDIYAMNGDAQQIIISLAFSSKFTVEAVQEIYKGIELACSNYEVDIVGGDMNSCSSGSVISISAYGYVDKKKVTYRNTAKDNDLIVVSGDLGGAYMGLQILEREKAVFKGTENEKKSQPDLEGNDYILERQLKPEARKDVLRHFENNEVQPTSMIDISDGLASELFHLCTKSETGCDIYDEKIPIDPMTFQRARDFNLDPTLCALSGGEDYELLFTIDQKDHDKLKNNADFTIIGHMTDENSGLNIITKDNKSFPIKAQGWDAMYKDKNG